jgi:hypothetical protein
MVTRGVETSPLWRILMNKFKIGIGIGTLLLLVLAIGAGQGIIR